MQIADIALILKVIIFIHSNNAMINYRLILLTLLASITLGMTSCSSSAQLTTSETSEEVTPPRPIAGPALAPGVVIIKASFSDYEEFTGGFKATATIKEVVEYGPATPVLSIGDTIVVSLPRSLLPEEYGSDIINSVNLRFQQQPLASGQTGAPIAWRVTRIN